MHFHSNDDAMQRYLHDIRQTAPLDRIKEQSYFQLICEARKTKANPNATRKELEEAETRQNLAREALVSANMRFVLSVALRYSHSSIPLPDLVSEGGMGLMHAIDGFDVSRGNKFISYATWWIKAYITRAIAQNGSLIRLPANQRQRVRKALKEQARGKEIGEDIRELIQLGERGISLDSPLKNDSKTTLSEVLADTKASSSEADAEAENFAAIARDLLAELPEREAKVISAIYGIDQEAPRSLREVGESMGISHERVRQLRDQALRRIRQLHTIDSIREKTDGMLGTSRPDCPRSGTAING